MVLLSPMLSAAAMHSIGRHFCTVLAVYGKSGPTAPCPHSCSPSTSLTATLIAPWCQRHRLSAPPGGRAGRIRCECLSLLGTWREHTALHLVLGVDLAYRDTCNMRRPFVKLTHF